MRTDEGVNISERRSLRNVQTEFKLPSSSSSSSSAFRLPPGACQVDSTAISVSVRGQRLAANSASRPCVCVCVCVHACGQKQRPSLINTFKQEKEEIATGQLSPPLDVGQIGEKVCFVFFFYSSTLQQYKAFSWLSPRNMMVLVHHMAHQAGRLPTLAPGSPRHKETHSRATSVWL